MTLSKASKIEVIRAFGNMTIKSALQDNYPSIGHWKRTYGIEKTEKVMSVILYEMSDSFNGALSKEHVEEICAELSSGILQNLSLEDLYICCRDLKMGMHRKKMDLNLVLSALRSHFDKRLELAGTISLNDHLAQAPNRHRESKKESEVQAHRKAAAWHMQNNK